MKLKSYLLLIAFFQLNLTAQIPPYTVQKSTNAPQGYYMFSVLRTGISSASHMIIDGNGNMIYHQLISNLFTFDFKKHVNGKISYFDNMRKHYIVMDSIFNHIDTVKSVGFETDSHELIIMPNNHYLLMGVEHSIADLSGYNIFLQAQVQGSKRARIQSNVIQELDASKNVVFQWHTKNNLSFDSADPYWLNDSDDVDWSHSNALEIDFDGNILLSSRHFNEITKINRQNGNVIWRLGGKYNQFTFNSGAVPFYGQHDARRISNGHITLYDNGNFKVPHAARSIEYEIDEQNLTAKEVWKYSYNTSTFSFAMGNTQRIQNHMSLVNYGPINTNSLCFNVVDSSGAQVFKLSFNNGLYCYRSFYYPQLPMSVHRPTISCFDSIGKKYLKAESGYASYRWNNGSSTQITVATGTNNLYVYVPCNNGFIYSEPVPINNVEAFCNVAGLDELAYGSRFKLYPNPTNDFLTVETLPNQNHIKLKIYDVSGKSVAVNEMNEINEGTLRLNVSNLAPGLYFVSLNNRMQKFIKQ